MAQYTEKSYKSIINKLRFIDSWFWGRYTINPYNGCQFGCIYCDARSAKYHQPQDFEEQIIVKQDPARLLDKRLKGARTFVQDVVTIGGVTDSYQPAEHRFRNTREILKVLQKYHFPVHIVTKSKLVLEDAAQLEAIAKQNWATVSFTVTTTDEPMARFLDKFAPTPEIRLRTLKQLKEQAPSVQAGVLAIPIVPFLGDSDAQLEDLVIRSKEAGADYLLFGGGMTLRDMQAKWFLKQLKEEYPELIPKYEALYKFTYNPEKYTGTHGPDPMYISILHLKLRQLCIDHGLPFRIPRFIPSDFRKTNYRIAEAFLNHAYELQTTGKPYQHWHWAGHNIQNLEESIETVAKREELSQIRNVEGEVEQAVREWL